MKKLNFNFILFFNDYFLRLSHFTQQKKLQNCNVTRENDSAIDKRNIDIKTLINGTSENTSSNYLISQHNIHNTLALFFQFKIYNKRTHFK